MKPGQILKAHRMTTVKRVVALLIQILIWNYSFCQTINQMVNTTVPKLNVVMPSPEAASLGKYGEIPVSLYSGVPDISVPLYTITLKDFKVPISISYHSSGIKVDEIASNVGLGWTLNTGGAIVQSVHGLPDDLDSGWLKVKELDKFSQDRQYRTTWKYDQSWWDNEDWWHDEDYVYLSGVLERKVDTQPDLFFVNFLGRSFKYFYDQQGKVYTMPYQKIKFDDYVITDENDIVYEFKSTEGTRTHNVYPNTNIPPEDISSTSHYLSRVVTPGGNVINYIYEDYTYQFENQPSETRYTILPFQQNCGSTNVQPMRTNSTSYVSGIRIKKISTNTGIEVEFTYDLDRLDLRNTKALTRVDIRDLSKSSARVKTITFNYDYYTAQISDANNPNKYRLRLQSVQELGSNPFKFKYKDGEIPARLSYSQDHWGYFNGAFNTTLLPEDPQKGFPYGANRAPNPAVVSNGLLQEISYPTGGLTTLEYEPNIAFSDVSTPSEFKSATAFAANNEVVVVPFTVSNPDPATFRVTYKAGMADGRYYDPVTDEYGDCDMRLKNSAGNTIKYFFGSNEAEGEPIPALEPGNYTFEIRTFGPGDQTNLFASITWYTLPSVSKSNTVTGGVRIKRITSNPIEGKQIVKYFEYKKSGSANISSGNQNFMPVYIHDHLVETIEGNGQLSRYNECKFLAQSSSSLMPLGTIQGGAVGYTEVNVYTTGPESGYTNNKFTYSEPPPYGWVFPFAPIIVNDWANALPTETTDYKWISDRSSYTPIKKTVNSYEFVKNYHNNEVRGAAIAAFKAPLTGLFDTFDPYYLLRAPEYKITYYYLRSSWYYKNKTIETTYNPIDSNQKVITEKKFFYDNPNHIQVTREEVMNSREQSYKILFRYPQDYNLAYPFNSSPVVEKKVMLNRSGGERTVNDIITIFKNSPGSFPLAYYTLKNTNLPTDFPLYNGGDIDLRYFEKRLEYSYDFANNISSVEVMDGLCTSFLWGYNSQFPIAQIKNAKPTDVYYTDFEDSEGNNTDYKTGGKSHLGPYSKKLVGLTNGKYIFSYWQKQNGEWGLVERAVSVADNTFTFGFTGTDLVDCIRFHPVDAEMTTYTFDTISGMTSEMDQKGKTTYYDYDNFLRLWHVKDQDRQVLKEYYYNYRQ